MAFDLEAFLTRCKKEVEEYADKVLAPPGRMPGGLYEAMRYSFMAGGKRVRPALVFGAEEAVTGTHGKGVAFAAALEMIHTYSLIHDDLPSMDDDDLRRGMPTCHVKYGEAEAILAGDALLTDAFSVMLSPSVVEMLGAGKVLRAAKVVADSAGGFGMVAGQALDIMSQGRVLDIATLEFLHTHKTGALIRASVLAGAIAAGASPSEEEALVYYAERLGLAFQVADDILDVEGNTDKLGKPVGSDEGLSKATYPALMGLSESKKRLAELTGEAVAALAPFGERAAPLSALAHFVANRDH